MSTGSAQPATAEPVVLIVGNPNVGKTSLFNGLTGSSARVGNYAGVTVDRREGRISLPEGSARLIDVPGTYSLSARSGEEQIAIWALLGLHENPTPQLAIATVDAGQLGRNLYLVQQLSELNVDLVVALNMVDEVDTPPDPAELAAQLGHPVVVTNGRTGEGVDRLQEVVAERLKLGPTPSRKLQAQYPAEIEADIDALLPHLPEPWRGDPVRERGMALWSLASIDEQDELLDIDPGLRAAVLERHEGAADRDVDHEIIAARYAVLDQVISDLSAGQEVHPPKRKTSESLDRVLLHPIGGFVFFLVLMLVVFQALFSWSDPAITLIEGGVAWLQQTTLDSLQPSIFRDFLANGLIGGVGNVLVFLPQILLLFFFLGLLESTGYMARVAYLMDRVMKAVGLNGKAFIPMMGGFACAVPAIMATRTMERRRDRLLTLLVIPLTTCSARLPVYTLIIGALFPPSEVFGFIPVQGLLMVAMYVFGLATTLLAAAIIGRTVVKGRRIPLLMELPPYRRPNLGAVVRAMFERGWVFVREAGTVIAGFTIILWALMSFPRGPDPTPGTPEHVAQAQVLEHSIAGRVGKGIEPVLKPLGFDWKIGVGLIGAFAAREVFVSTMGMVYGIAENVDEKPAPLRARMKAEKRPDGKPIYTPLMGLSLMIFFALACQCMSTLAVVKRETRSWRWPAFMFGYMTTLAYVCSLVVYQGGKLLGF